MNPENITLNRKNQENPNSIIKPHMVEMNSKIKISHKSDHPIEKNEWFKGGKENNVDVFRSQGVMKLYIF